MHALPDTTGLYRIHTRSSLTACHTPTKASISRFHPLKHRLGPIRAPLGTVGTVHTIHTDSPAFAGCYRIPSRKVETTTISDPPVEDINNKVQWEAGTNVTTLQSPSFIQTPSVVIAFIGGISIGNVMLRSYHHESTRSHQNSEVKRGWA